MIRDNKLKKSKDRRPLNVMILHAPIELAGAEGVILNINRFVDPSKVKLFNCPFINFNREKGAYQKELEVLGIPYNAIPLKRRFEYRYISATEELIRKHQIDVIHSHGYRSDITALLAARGRIPVVSTLHGFTASDFIVKIYEKIQLRMLKHMTTLIPVSKSIEDRLLNMGIEPEKIQRLPNIVDIDALSQLEPSTIYSDMGAEGETLRLAYVGRLSPEKGVDILIDSCAILRAMQISFLLLIVGEGPLRKNLETMVRKHHLSEHVIFLGFQRNATSIIAASDVMVLPSRTEGIPLVVLEAMALARPVIASNVGGLPELIQQQVNGFLFESGDTKGLAELLIFMFHHREQIRKMGELGKRFVHERFNPQRWTERLIEIYYKAASQIKSTGLLRILTNHPGQKESPTWDAMSTRIQPRGNDHISALRTAIVMYLRHWNYDCVVLGGGRIDIYYALLQTFFPFGRKPCIMIDCLWYKSTSRLGSFIKIIIMRLMDKSIDRYVVWARREIDAYAREFHLRRDKFIFIPYHTTLDTFNLLPDNKEYIFSGGNFDRDYPTLIEAIRNLPVKVLIACTRPELFDGITLPDNVIIQGFGHKEYLDKMAGCSISVVAMAPGLLHSGGQQTILNSMYLGKPTIVTDPAGAKDYIDHGKDGLLVEPANPKALRNMIISLLDDAEKAYEMGQKAKMKANQLSTEVHFQSIISLTEKIVKEKGRNIKG